MHDAPATASVQLCMHACNAFWSRPAVGRRWLSASHPSSRNSCVQAQDVSHPGEVSAGDHSWWHGPLAVSWPPSPNIPLRIGGKKERRATGARLFVALSLFTTRDHAGALASIGKTVKAGYRSSNPCDHGRKSTSITGHEGLREFEVRQDMHVRSGTRVWRFPTSRNLLLLCLPSATTTTFSSLGGP